LIQRSATISSGKRREHTVGFFRRFRTNTLDGLGDVVDSGLDGIHSTGRGRREEGREVSERHGN